MAVYQLIKRYRLYLDNVLGFSESMGCAATIRSFPKELERLFAVRNGLVKKFDIKVGTIGGEQTENLGIGLNSRDSRTWIQIFEIDDARAVIGAAVDDSRCSRVRIEPINFLNEYFSVTKEK
jgi:hypothetical protein